MDSTGESGGPGWQQRGGQPDSPSESRDNRFTTFEQVSNDGRPGLDGTKLSMNIFVCVGLFVRGELI